MNHPPKKPRVPICPAAIATTAAIFALWVSTLGASAQPYSIDWYKVAGGGGTSSNAQFTITGTIGQADATAPLNGGTYTLSGGFWTIYAVQTPGAPSLRISLTTTNTVVVSWPSPSIGFSLQVTTNLTTWGTPPEIVNNNGIVKSIIVSPPAGNRYYRLSNP